MIKTMTKEKLYKVLGKGGKCCSGGIGRWHLPNNGRPGKWMPKIKNLKICKSGYHLCREQDLIYWLNEEIYEVEYRGDRIDEPNKIVVAQARLVRKVRNWNDRIARLFTCDCAKSVLKYYTKVYPTDNRARDGIRAAQAFANGEITWEQFDIAGEAAWAAARAAAKNAAKDGARDGARAAARAMAWAAKAADTTAYGKLSKILFEYLNGTRK